MTPENPPLWLRKLNRFHNRMSKLNINVELGANYPWIYIDKINHIPVKEKFWAEHGFTVLMTGVRLDHKPKFTDLKEIFKLIRQYRDKYNSITYALSV